jgi:hypothetical protein
MASCSREATPLATKWLPVCNLSRRRLERPGQASFRTPI